MWDSFRAAQETPLPLPGERRCDKMRLPIPWADQGVGVGLLAGNPFFVLRSLARIGQGRN